MGKLVFLPGGSSNVGAPTAKELQEGTDLTPYLMPWEAKVNTMHEELVRLGWSADAAARALGTFTDLADSPKRELLFRVNAWCKGEDPGKPNHWRGLQ